jgi:hypothetical protein
MNYDMVAYMAITTIKWTLLDFSVRVPDIHRGGMVIANSSC